MADSFHHILDSIHEEVQPCVLATIVGVEGSSYRKEGASMLFLDNGKQVGLLSGGCLEQDLSMYAPDVLSTGQSLTVTYNTSAEDDLSWGQGIGCNGSIQVLLEPIDSWMRDQLYRLKLYLGQGIPVLSFRKLNMNGMERACFIPYKGEVFGNTHEAAYLQDIVKDQNQPALTPKNGIRFLPSVESSYYTPYYFHQYTPKPRLYVFGAGPDARPLVQFASQAGFGVTLCDWREALCSKHHFPYADECIVGNMTEILTKIHLSPKDAVVLMTHHFQHDRSLMEVLLQQDVFYLGILGPRKRTSRIMNGNHIPEFVHSPVGLPIGAEGPEEIAISIVAEIIASHRLGPIKAKGVFNEIQ